MKKFLTTAALCVAAVGALASIFRGQSPSQSPTPVPPPEITWGVQIPMRDGVKLHGNLYRPRGSKEKLPVILFLTPYAADGQHERASAFAKSGYSVIVVDVRGRGNSGGNFVPFVNDGRDGYDIVEWAAVQPWSNGKVAMHGGSYLGGVQWLTLKERPPHLVTIIPMVIEKNVPGFAPKNIPLTNSVSWLAYVSGKTRNENLWNDQQYWRACVRKLRADHAPFNTLDSVCGFPSPIFQKWLSHPIKDQYFDSHWPTSDDYKRMDIPILEMGVYFDPNDFFHYREHTRLASPEAAARHYFVVGPWTHFLLETSRSSQVGPWKFGEASVVDLIKLHTEWYDWTMKNGPKPAFLKKNVAYYAIGPEEWRYADSLDAIPTTARKFYLGSHGGQLSVKQPGSLTEVPMPDSAPGSYKYDPLEIDYDDVGREVLYETGPFAEDTDIVGQMKVVAWMSIDVPDTDFVIYITERDPAGRRVGPGYEDVIRARYRESLRTEKLVKPGEINRYEFNNLKWRYRRISKGNRLRVYILSDLGSAYQKNYNSGGVVAKETAKDARTATVKVYHDSKYRSFLEIPFVR
jgi:predicted acyl esterase